MLLKKAAQDEDLLDEILSSSQVSDEIIGFHLQQAAEKLLKALLAAHGIHFGRTHNLRVLIDLLTDGGQPLPPFLQDLDVLTPFATLLRYEDIPTEASIDREAGREMIRKLRLHVESTIGEQST